MKNEETERMQKNNSKKYNNIILRKDTINKIKNTGDIINIGTGILSSVNPAFSLIPVFVYAINWTFGLANPEYIVKRLNKINEKLIKRKISIEDFKDEILNLSEHNEYIVLNHLRNILLVAIPENVDIYIELIIDFIMKKEYDEKETLCEIVNMLSKKDIQLLRMIKEYRDNGDREYFNKNTEKAEKEKIENEKIDEHNNKPNHGLSKLKWVNRNVVINDLNTIFWKDFEKYYELQSGEMGFILLEQTIDEKGNKSKEWAYIGKSIIKLQNLGIIELDYINTTGNINSLNVERFHITLFGNEMLKYIK